MLMRRPWARLTEPDGAVMVMTAPACLVETRGGGGGGDGASVATVQAKSTLSGAPTATCTGVAPSAITLTVQPAPWLGMVGRVSMGVVGGGGGGAQATDASRE
jgi:hypothetical protein